MLGYSKAREGTAAVSTFLFLAAYALIVYRNAIAFTFNPEDPLHFVWNADLSWRAVWNSYFHFDLDHNWYRPTTFHLNFKILRYFIGWHDFVALRYLNLLLYSLAAFSTYRLGVFLFGDRRFALLAAVYFLSLPALYLSVYNVNSFDFIYQILCAETILLFWKSGRQASRTKYFAAWLLSVFAVTSKEAALAVPVFLFASDLFFYRPLTKALADGEVPFWRKSIWRTLPFFVVPFFILVGKLNSGGGGAALAFDPAKVWDRLSIFTQWLFRLYYAGFLTTVFSNKPNHLFAEVLILIFLVGLGRLLWRWRRGEADLSGRWHLGVCLLWVVVFLLMPAWVGGFPWHISLSAMGFGLLLVGLGDEALAGLGRWRGVSYGAAILLLAFLSHRDFLVWVEKNPHRRQFDMNEATLRSPPIPPAQLKPGTAFLVLDSEKWGHWSYGVNALFAFVYLRQDVTQVNYPDLSTRELKAWLAVPNRICVDWDSTAMRWNDKTRECEALIHARTD